MRMNKKNVLLALGYALSAVVFMANLPIRVYAKTVPISAAASDNTNCCMPAR